MRYDRAQCCVSVILGLQEMTFTEGQSEGHDLSGDMKSPETPPAPTSSTTSGSWVSLLTLDYYQSLFDVSTKQVC